MKQIVFSKKQKVIYFAWTNYNIYVHSYMSRTFQIIFYYIVVGFGPFKGARRPNMSNIIVNPLRKNTFFGRGVTLIFNYLTIGSGPSKGGRRRPNFFLL